MHHTNNENDAEPIWKDILKFSNAANPKEHEHFTNHAIKTNKQKRAIDQRHQKKRPIPTIVGNPEHANTEGIRLAHNKSDDGPSENTETELTERRGISIHEPGPKNANMKIAELINTTYVDCRSNGWNSTIQGWIHAARKQMLRNMLRHQNTRKRTETIQTQISGNRPRRKRLTGNHLFANQRNKRANDTPRPAAARKSTNYPYPNSERWERRNGTMASQTPIRANTENYTRSNISPPGAETILPIYKLPKAGSIWMGAKTTRPNQAGQWQAGLLSRWRIRMVKRGLQNRTQNPKKYDRKGGSNKKRKPNCGSQPKAKAGKGKRLHRKQNRNPSQAKN